MEKKKNPHFLSGKKLEHPLKAYFEANSVKINHFCKKHGICQANIYRIIDGADAHVSILHKIEKATGGKVTIYDMIPTVDRIKPKGRPKAMREKNKTAAKTVKWKIEDVDISGVSEDLKGPCPENVVPVRREYFTKAEMIGKLPDDYCSMSMQEIDDLFNLPINQEKI